MTHLQSRVYTQIREAELTSQEGAIALKAQYHTFHAIKGQVHTVMSTLQVRYKWHYKV